MWYFEPRRKVILGHFLAEREGLARLRWPFPFPLREQSNGRRTAVPVFAYTGIRLQEQALDAHIHIRKNAALSCGAFFALHSAEREGFEPPDPRRSTVFKTAVIDHSTTSPSRSVIGLQIAVFRLRDCKFRYFIGLCKIN